jgi:hypothetical protein
MSFLAPLYAFALALLAAPIVLHLIRRSPRGQVPFSSLMYLTSTPPRLTRWSRLDNLLLLLLRALALTLLIVAFTRPFLREDARFDSGGAERRRIAVLIDTSASMRRAGIWPRAKMAAGEVIAACRPADEIGVFAFDRSARVLLGFEEAARLDTARRQAVARALVDGLEPTWAATNLGGALIDAALAIEDAPDTSEKTGRMPRRVIVISDLAQGSRLEALGDFEWPSDVDLELRTISDDGSNAGLQLMSGPAELDAAESRSQRRVRVYNDVSSRREAFELCWVDQAGRTAGKPVPVYVPPGESRGVAVSQPPKAPPHHWLRLSGDTHGFDNLLYFADERRDEAKVLYLGNDLADDPSGLLYYLRRVYVGFPERSIEVFARSPQAAFAWDPPEPPSLVVLACDTTPGNVRRLQEYLRRGGTLLYVTIAPGQAETLAALAGVGPCDVPDAIVERDAMLGEISFDNRLFASLAGPQFNDFTKIHFWKYRRYDPGALGGANVAARFENGDPAVIEKAVGKGRLIVLASGWHPADSQLARSSKFVPFMAAVLEGRNARPTLAARLVVGERIVLPAVPGPAHGVVVHKPDGSSVKLPADSAAFADTDVPGVYSIDMADGTRSVAVNLDPMESKTTPLNVETLEQLGCRMANPARKRIDDERLRQMHNMDLEERQKLWRYLILAAIAVLIVETLLAGRLKKLRPALPEGVAT